MAKLEIPVVIDGVKSIEELANRVLDEYEYQGRTIREWADRIAHPETNADRIRSMADEELAEWYFTEFFPKAPYCNKPECFEDSPCEKCLLDWLKEEAEK